MQRSKKTLIAAGLIAFALAGAVLIYAGFRRSEASDSSPVPALFSEVPAGASSVVYIDFAAVRASTFYRQRPDKGPIALPDRDYADFVQSTGFDFEKDLDRVIIASWAVDGNGKQNIDQNKRVQNQTVLIADGRFDRKKIHDYALRKGKVDHQEGREVFLFPTDKQPGWNSLVFLNDQRIAIVGGQRIAPLSTPHGDASVADALRDRAARVNGAAMFAISRVPSIPDNFSAGGMQAAPLMSLARSLQWVTLAARPEGNNLRVSLEGECQTATDARQLQASLEVFRMIGQASLGGSKAQQSMDPATLAVIQSVLKTADITASAERVRILVELTPDILKLGGSRKQ